MKKETLLTIAMSNTIQFLEDQSGMPKEFFENVKVVPLHHVLDVVESMAEQIDRLMETNQKLRHEKTNPQQ